MPGFMGLQGVSLAQGAFIFQIEYNLTGLLEFIATLFAMAASETCIHTRLILSRVIVSSVLGIALCVIRGHILMQAAIAVNHFIRTLLGSISK